MNIKSILLSLATVCSLSAAAGDGYYVKHVAFPENATLDEKVEMASRLVPDSTQLAWQQLEMTAFIHFGINTFTGREWGEGTESPELFNPTELDARQWVKALKDGGFRMVILTAKHHDGFCLWPTKTTRHSVASSPWKNGKGDVVAELKQACDELGMKFGVYLSPWDRNAECYGDSPRYNDFFVEQLTELLSNYGEVHEVWFDGACGEGPNGKKQVYDWKRYYDTIHRLQPKAVTAIMGDDVRWVGNEKGLGRDTEWSATALVPGGYERADAENKRLGLFPKAADLGSRELLANARELFWYPSEVDVSIRPGWFYHEYEDGKVKTLAQLVDIYYNSVGRNSVLLLNVPPDKRGLIHATDVERMRLLNEYLQRNFANNLVKDGSRERTVEAGKSVTCDFAKPADVNTVVVCENIAKGQRVEEFAVSVMCDGKWKEVATGTTVGYKRIVRFPTVMASAVKVDFLQARADVNVRAVEAYCTEVLADKAAEEVVSDIPTDKWTVVSATGKDVKNARLAVDGKKETHWCSKGGKFPKQVTVDLKQTVNIAGFRYLPIQGDDKAGTVYNYKFYVSNDGKNWKECSCSGEFSNIMHNPILQIVEFGKTYEARYFRFEALSEIDSRDFVTVGELGLIVK